MSAKINFGMNVGKQCELFFVWMIMITLHFSFINVLSNDVGLHFCKAYFQDNRVEFVHTVIAKQNNIPFDFNGLN